MSIGMKDYLGEWSSAGWHTHPPADPRAVYYPPDGAKIRAVLGTASIYMTPGAPPETISVIKFIVLDKVLYPKLAALEIPDYHFLDGRLVSTPVQVSATEWFTDVIEMIEPGSAVAGSQNPSLLPAMRHNLLWNDGLRAKWICCFSGV